MHETDRHIYTHTHTHIPTLSFHRELVKKKVKLVSLVEGDPKATFSIATTPFSGLLHFTLDPYLIMLGAKQGGIKYHFLSLWYDLYYTFIVSKALCKLHFEFCYVPQMLLIKGKNPDLFVK